MATRIVFSNKLLASHRATSVFADFGSVRVLIGRRWRVSPWIVLTLGEDGFAVIREGQDLWSLLDMPKFLNAATAPSWVWWDDQLNPEQLKKHWGQKRQRHRQPHQGPGEFREGSRPWWTMKNPSVKVLRINPMLLFGIPVKICKDPKFEEASRNAGLFSWGLFS